MIKEYLNGVDYSRNSQYFTLEYVKEIGGTPCFLIDLETGLLRYSCVEIAPKLYVDIGGAFTSFKSRGIDESTELQIIRFNTLEQAKDYLKYLKVRYTDVYIKRDIRTFLRNTILTFTVQSPNVGDVTTDIGIIGVDRLNVAEYFNNGNVIYLFYDTKKSKFIELYTSMSKIRLRDLYIGNSRFEKFENWQKKVKKG